MTGYDIAVGLCMALYQKASMAITYKAISGMLYISPSTVHKAIRSLQASNLAESNAVAAQEKRSIPHVYPHAFHRFIVDGISVSFPIELTGLVDDWPASTTNGIPIRGQFSTSVDEAYRLYVNRKGSRFQAGVVEFVWPYAWQDVTDRGRYLPIYRCGCGRGVVPLYPMLPKAVVADSTLYRGFYYIEMIRFNCSHKLSEDAGKALAGLLRLIRHQEGPDIG